jgi:hypothetical protein
MRLNTVIVLGLLLFIALNFTSCVSLNTLSTADYQSIANAKEALVIVRIQSVIDGTPENAFPCSELKNPLMSFGIGSFKTVGEPRYTVNRYLSDESCRAGWTFFLLSPGIYYLSVYGPATTVHGAGDYLVGAPRWQVDIPDTAGLVYIGTVQVHGNVVGKLMFGDKIIRPLPDQALVIYENDRAVALLKNYFANASDLKTVEIKRWYPGDPIIIRTPKNDLKK